MPVRVNQTRHENAPTGINLYGAIRCDELSSNCRNVIVNNKDIPVLDHPERWINSQDGGVTKYYGTA